MWDPDRAAESSPAQKWPLWRGSESFCVVEAVTSSLPGHPGTWVRMGARGPVAPYAREICPVKPVSPYLPWRPVEPVNPVKARGSPWNP